MTSCPRETTDLNCLKLLSIINGRSLYASIDTEEFFNISSRYNIPNFSSSVKSNTFFSLIFTMQRKMSKKIVGKSD